MKQVFIETTLLKKMFYIILTVHLTGLYFTNLQNHDCSTNLQIMNNQTKTEGITILLVDAIFIFFLNNLLCNKNKYKYKSSTIQM